MRLTVVAKSRPPSDHKSAWHEWPFQFENYLACVSDSMLQEPLAEGSATLVNPPSDGAQSRSRKLFAILAWLTLGRANQMVRQLRMTRSGYEVWRQLVLEFEPKSDSRQLALLMQVKRADGLQGRDGPEFMSALLR